MNTQSRMVFNGFGYEASIAGFKANNGPFLCITRKDKGGKYLSGAQALEWCNAIETSIDDKERATLCRAVYQA
jgi:hypothetical protein